MHVIQPGDILYNLAMQYGVTVQVDLCQVFRHILSKRRSLYNAIWTLTSYYEWGR